MKRVATTIALLCALLIAACSGNHVGLRRANPGGLQPSLTPIARPYKILGAAETSVSSFNLLWSVGVTGAPDFERARRELIQSKNGDDIIQVSWYIEKEFWVLGTIDILHIKATVIQFEKLTD